MVSVMGTQRNESKEYYVTGCGERGIKSRDDSNFTPGRVMVILKSKFR